MICDLVLNCFRCRDSCAIHDDGGVCNDEWTCQRRTVRPRLRQLLYCEPGRTEHRHHLWPYYCTYNPHHDRSSRFVLFIIYTPRHLLNRPSSYGIIIDPNCVTKIPGARNNPASKRNCVESFFFFLFSPFSVVEPLAVFGMAYFSYLSAELFHFSGIIRYGST